MADISQVILPGGETPQNIKALKIPYGTCSTAAATAAKTVTIKSDNGSTGNNAPFVLETGSIIAVKFTVTNTAANPTLNVNGTGAKAIYYRESTITKSYLAAKSTYCFIYDGTQWEFIGDIDTNSNTTYTLSSGTEEGTLKLTSNSGSAQDNKKVTGWENVYKKQDDVHLTSIEEYQAIGNEKYWDGKNYYVDDDTPIFPPTAHIYGWQVDPEESDPAAAVTYLEDAVGMTPASMGSTAFNYGSWKDAFFMPKPCMVKNDGTVDYYLDTNDYTKKLDGTASDIANAAYDGNAMMEWPLIWWKYEAGETEGEGYFYVSNVKVDNTYNCYCNINCDNQIVEHFYTAIYNGTTAPAYSSSVTYAVDDLCTHSGGLYKCITAVETAESFDATKWELVNSVTPLRSISGLALTSANGNGSTTYSQESTRALANNTTAKTEWFIDVWSDRMLINGLLILMGKSLNSQATFGRGLDSGNQAAKEAYVTGTLNNKGLFWGSTSSGAYGVKVFGMENWYSCVWHRTAGLIGLANGNTAYKMTYGTADGTTANGYNTTGDGYHINTVARPSPNYVKSCKFGNFGYLPLTTGGSSSTYYSDYWYTNNSALTFALVGGSSYNGAYAGVSYVYLNLGVGSATWDIAAALTLKPLA